VTVRGLRAGGLSGAEVADGMVCFGILTYGVYVVAVAVAGFGLWFALFSGPAPVGLTLVPATVATAAILAAASMLFANQRVTRFLERRAERSTGRASSWWHRAAAAPRALPRGPAQRPGDGRATRSVPPRRDRLVELTRTLTGGDGFAARRFELA
jgi:hypothetical protein